MEAIENNVKLKKMLVLKIILAIVFVIATIFTVSFVSPILKGLEKQGWDSLGAAIAMVIMLVYGLISYLPSLILSIVGTVVAGIRRRKGIVSKCTLAYFIVFLALTILCCVATVLFVVLIA